MDDMASPASVALLRRVGAWALAAVGAALAARLSLSINGRVTTHYFYPSTWLFVTGIMGGLLLVLAWLLVTRPSQRKWPFALLVLALVLAATIPPLAGPLVQPVPGAPRFGWIAFSISTLPMVIGVLSWMMARGRPRNSMVAAAVAVFVAAWLLPYMTLWPDGFYRLSGVGTPVAVACVIAVWVGWAVEVAGRQMVGGALVAGAVSWRLVVTAAVVFGVVMVIAGFAYGRSESFKIECGAHKLTGVSIGWFKNTVCDADFAIKSGS